MKLHIEGGILLVTILSLSKVQGSEEQLRNKKHFSLFSVVTFKNEECTSETTFAGGATAGTCYTSTECSDKKGTKSGNCASGFGVCCILIENSGATATISENRTHIRNPLYPTAETAVPASQTYTISRMQSDICQVRLDFDNFVIAGPSNTVESAANTLLSGNCKDKMTTALGSGFLVPVLCGVMTGEHLYLDVGMTTEDTTTLAFTFAATTSITATAAMRTWSIKTSQIPCWAPYRAPEGCHRYFMQHTGQIISPNFARLSTDTVTGTARVEGTLLSGLNIMNQYLKTCIRREKGMCCTRFQVCNQFAGIALTDYDGNGATGDTDGGGSLYSEGYSFHTDLTNAGTAAANEGGLGANIDTAIYLNQGIVDVQCTTDYVEIPDSSTGFKNYGGVSQANTRYCGARFGFVPPIAGAWTSHAAVYDCTEPWEVIYYTDNANDDGDFADAGTNSATEERGLCLDFAQEVC